MTQHLTKEYTAKIASDLPDNASVVEIASLFATIMSVYGIDDTESATRLLTLTLALVEHGETMEIGVGVVH